MKKYTVYLTRDGDTMELEVNALNVKAVRALVTQLHPAWTFVKAVQHYGSDD